ncbi:MAG: hypothetical protein M1828_004845 [Chrysothrix sp. TS-e1954]|nr:MAG: hypothetical protein M1828_004845 [Chrysothrix sp. TS-e1954]
MSSPSPPAKEAQTHAQLTRLHSLRETWLAGNLVPLSRKQAQFPRDLPGRGPAGSPATFRTLPTALASAKGAGARVCSTSYRLAPQDPFPAGLMDVLNSYLSLLHPPPGSFHAPVDPSKLVLAGDSAGANLCLALIQILLHLRRQDQGITILHWHDGATIDTRTIPLPAGIVLTSPWLDLTTTSRSWASEPNLIDILELTQPPLLPNFPADPIWPSTPPRGHPYCEPSSLDHPLVSPSAASDWTDAPPMFLGVGGAERARDGVRAVAVRAAAQGVNVRYAEYENMPHDFAVVLGGKIPAADHCLRSMGLACRSFLDSSAGEALSDAKLYLMPDCEEHRLELRDLELSGGWKEDVRRMRVDAEEKMNRGPWIGGERAKM